eukprot:11426871-Heterocapsa_arctica.AAC.1
MRATPISRPQSARDRTPRISIGLRHFNTSRHTSSCVCLLLYLSAFRFSDVMRAKPVPRRP